MSYWKTKPHDSTKGIMTTNTSPSAWHKLLAMLALRCPRCLRGHVFARFTTMNENCPECGYRFEREPGYFVGSMYISYTIAMILMLLLMLAFYIVWPELDPGMSVLIAAALFTPFVPVTWRYSRVLWMFVDRWAWPDNSGP